MTTAGAALLYRQVKKVTDVSDLDYPSYGPWMPEEFPAGESWDQVFHQPDYSSARRPEARQPGARRPPMAFRPRGRTGLGHGPPPRHGPAPHDRTGEHTPHIT